MKGVMTNFDRVTILGKTYTVEARHRSVANAQAEARLLHCTYTLDGKSGLYLVIRKVFKEARSHAG